MGKFAKIVQIIVQNNLLIIFFSLSLSMVLPLLPPLHEAAFNYCEVALASNVLFLSWVVLTSSFPLLPALGNQVEGWFAKA